MRTVKIDKDQLVDILEENRKTHQKTYKDAYQKYRELLIKALEDKLKDAKDGKKVEHHISLQSPTSYVDSYDTVLRMLHMSVDDIIELSHEDFEKYVEDKWDWTFNFTTVNSAYV